MNSQGDILYISNGDRLGGAARDCWTQFNGVMSRGLPARLMVKEKITDHVLVERIDPDLPDGAARPALDKRGLGPMGLIQARFGLALGLEDWYFPRSHGLIEQAEHARLVHCHNLHEGFFDLRILPRLSKAAPLILSMHDAWLLGGHCAHSLGCSKWTTGCVGCSDPARYPAIKRGSGAALNWQRRKKIFQNSRLHVVTPCQWLMDKVHHSILEPGVIESKVIPYGLDLDLYAPGDRSTLRRELNLPEDSVVVLFAAANLKNNIWKDYETFRKGLEIVARSTSVPISFVALGADEPSERLSEHCEVRFVPFIRDDRKVADYFRACDVYLHAARADTFPNAVLEALACGVPVIGSAVGGIPEQIMSIKGFSGIPETSRNHATGVLVPGGSAELLAEAVISLAEDRELRERLGKNGRLDAKKRFHVEREVDAFVSWYGELVEKYAAEA